MSCLLIEEERNKQSEQATALVSRCKIVKQQKDMKCFECNKPGHVKKHFPV